MTHHTKPSQLRERRCARLYFGEGEDAWSIADPEDPSLEEAMYRMRYMPEQLTNQDRWRILAAAEAYQHLICYPLREYTRQQFADIRRAVKP